MPMSLLSVHGRRGLIHRRILPAGRQAAPCKRLAALCQSHASVSTVAEAAYGLGAAQCVDAFCDRGALFAESQVRTGTHAAKARWMPGLHV